MYTCGECGFECMSKALFEQHREREKLGLSEKVMMIQIRKAQREHDSKGNKSR
jgi:hypothetical protein